ncbi:hypothetical protein DVH24_013213 [Malus domestica]|uniref:Uncharacterized protein n=1 Tax=Malus domestica TaxID=3750 RepID=A0A498IK85_MALDO|nr:hypothetical protein DVH24_013213 [Malus domestica]
MYKLLTDFIPNMSKLMFDFRKVSHPSLDSAVTRYCPLWAYHFLTVLFLGTQTRTSQWDCSHPNSLNFEVPMKYVTSEFPKGLIRRHITPSPLVDVGSYNPILSHPSLDSTVTQYCPLWAYHSLTDLFLGTQTRTPQ